MYYQLAIFDLDGTLLNTLEDLADTANATLTHYGLPVVPAENYKNIIGGGAKKLCEIIMGPKATAEIGVEAFNNYRMALYDKSWMIKTREYEGITKALEALREAGVKLAVLSNKTDVFTQVMVKHFFPNIAFDYCMGLRADMRPKPDPDGILEALRVLNIQPKDTVYFGDSGSDMEASVRAGVVAAAVTWGFRGREELTAGGAQLFIDAPHQIPSACKM